MCLIILLQASESPGGWASDSSHDLFPKITTSFEPNNVTFDPQTFEDVANAYGTFTHKTEEDTPDSRTQVQQDWLAKWELQSDNETTFITTVVDDIEL